MDLASNRIPNKMLTGDELAKIVVKECEEMLKRDCLFNANAAYKRAAFTLHLTVDLGYPHPADHKVISFVGKGGIIEGEAPLKEIGEDESVHFQSTETRIELDNPNLARVQHGLPIKLTEKLPQVALPQSGIPEEDASADVGSADPFPKFKVHELQYDASQYPAAKAPADKDVTESKARSLDIKRGKK